MHEMVFKLGRGEEPLHCQCTFFGFYIPPLKSAKNKRQHTSLHSARVLHLALSTPKTGTVEGCTQYVPPIPSAGPQSNTPDSVVDGLDHIAAVCLNVSPPARTFLSGGKARPPFVHDTVRRRARHSGACFSPAARRQRACCRYRPRIGGLTDAFRPRCTAAFLPPRGGSAAMSPSQRPPTPFGLVLTPGEGRPISLHPVSLLGSGGDSRDIAPFLNTPWLEIGANERRPGLLLLLLLLLPLLLPPLPLPPPTGAAGACRPRPAGGG